jgi:glycerol-3-phosphate acyltransferase PlsX
MADITIAVDCMGGDFGPSVTIPAIKNVLLNTHNLTERLSSNTLELSFHLYGDIQQLEKCLSEHQLANSEHIQIFSSSNDVLMSDFPSEALKNKKQSSMRLSLEAVRDGRAHACVSAGNTGALMAVSRFVLKMLPGISRPAIISALPTHKNGQVYLLDLGANVECNEQRLTQFAIMGNELCRGLDGIDSPRVGLLNIGEEENKGSERLRQAAKLIGQLDNLNYVGFAEANQIFSGDYEVIVTDGFTGNNVLKASEGLSHFLLERIKHAFSRNWWTKLIGLLAKPVMNLVREQVNPEKYNGACLLGLRGIVIKSHGSANIEATSYAIEEAIIQAEQCVPAKIKQQLSLIENN